jgi:hypothetical protein
VAVDVPSKVKRAVGRWSTWVDLQDWIPTTAGADPSEVERIPTPPERKPADAEKKK